MRHSTKADRKATGADLKAAVHRAQAFLARRRARADVHPRLLEARLSADLGRPGRRHEGARDRSGPRGDRHRLGRLQRAFLPYADPAGVTAVDLNGAHIALGRLKICALENLPDYETFFRFFGRADARTNVGVYDQWLRAGSIRRRAPIGTSAGRSAGGASASSPATSIGTALLGHFLGAGHALARLHGIDPSVILEARTIEEQRRLYEERLAPIFDKPLVRWMMKQPASLYGLGIPPAQYKALAADSPEGIGDVLQRSASSGWPATFDIGDNYFAWQAFGRRYAPGPNPVSAALSAKRENFEAVRSRADRVRYVQRSFTEILRECRRRASTAMCCSTRRTG